MLREQRFAELLATAQGMLAAQPQQRDALLFAAIAQRLLGRIPDALKTLGELIGVAIMRARFVKELADANCSDLGLAIVTGTLPLKLK